MTIGEKIALLLNQKNITAKELSKRTGISVQTFSNWKKGRIKKPRLDIIGKIAKALDCDIEEFKEYL
jgi:transcriptional regulator with XRE-family HTH domain